LTCTVSRLSLRRRHAFSYLLMPAPPVCLADNCRAFPLVFVALSADSARYGRAAEHAYAARASPAARTTAAGRQAHVGHFVSVAIATLLSVPLGYWPRFYITEFGPDRRTSRRSVFAAKVLPGPCRRLAGVFAFAVCSEDDGRVVGVSDGRRAGVGARALFDAPDGLLTAKRRLRRFRRGCGRRQSEWARNADASVDKRH